jgi:hypothetical protein
MSLEHSDRREDIKTFLFDVPDIAVSGFVYVEKIHGPPPEKLIEIPVKSQTILYADSAGNQVRTMLFRKKCRISFMLSLSSLQRQGNRVRKSEKPFFSGFFLFFTGFLRKMLLHYRRKSAPRPALHGGRDAIAVFPIHNRKDFA